MLSQALIFRAKMCCGGGEGFGLQAELGESVKLNGRCVTSRQP